MSNGINLGDDGVALPKAREQSHYSSSVGFVLAVAMCVLPSVLFLVKSGHRTVAPVFVLVLAGVGFFSSVVVSSLTRRLRLYRTIDGVITFWLLGGFCGLVVNFLVYLVLSFLLVFFARLPLTAFFNAAVVLFMLSAVGLCVGLFVGAFCLPKKG